MIRQLALSTFGQYARRNHLEDLQDFQVVIVGLDTNMRYAKLAHANLQRADLALLNYICRRRYYGNAEYTSECHIVECQLRQDSQISTGVSPIMHGAISVRSLALSVCRSRLEDEHGCFHYCQRFLTVMIQSRICLVTALRTDYGK